MLQLATTDRAFLPGEEINITVEPRRLQVSLSLNKKVIPKAC